ncbi:N-acetylmuramoyl-L-alanine amidase [candidate division KSB1 bacterium]
MKKIIPLLLLLLPVSVFAQIDTLKLLIVYPEMKDTVSFNRIRISGSTNPEAELTINSKDVKVYPSGAFGYLYYLEEGRNEIRVESKEDEDYQVRVLNIYRKPGIRSSSETPTSIENIMMEPSQDLIIMPGEILNVKFKGSPGGNAKFKFGKWGKNIPMTELPPEETGGLRGIYSGSLILKDKGDRKSEQVEFELKGLDRKRVKVKSEAQVKVYSNDSPMVGVINSDDSIVRVKPGGAIFTSLNSGVKVNINGKFGSYFKIRLTNNFHCYVHESNIKLLPEGSFFQSVRVNGISIQQTDDHYILRLSMSGKCPFNVEENISQATIVLNIYNAYDGGGWMRYPENDSLIYFIKPVQKYDDVYSLEFSFNIDQLWGYKTEYVNGGMLFYIKKPPKFFPEPESVFKGVKIALDAGHGGEHLGAVGGTGVMEKDINLNYTFKLAELLKSEGADVIITRNIDTTMFLSPRYKIADSLNADIFVWLHNNSIGLTTDPFEVRGTSTYYTHPHSFEISRITYKYLKDIGLDPFGNISASFYITRQTSVLTFLVEGAFLSNVEDEMLLLDDEFLNDLAEAVFKGLKVYLTKARINISETVGL